eukprot:tig00000553_g2086.t1
MSKRASSSGEADVPAIVGSFAVPPPAHLLDDDQIEIDVTLPGAASEGGPAKKLKATLKAGSLEYSSLPQPMSSRLYIGAVSSSGKLSLKPAVPLRFVPPATAREEQESDAQVDARKRLTDLFGSRKARLSLRAKDRGALRDVNAPPPERPAAQPLDRASSVSAKAELEATGVPRSYLPAYDVEAEEASGVYDLQALTLGALSRITPKELEAMEEALQKPQEFAKKWREEGTAPEFVCMALPMIGARHDAEIVSHKAGLVVLLCVYFYFHVKPVSSLADDIPRLASSLGTTAPVATAVLEAFAERADANRYGKPQALVDKCIAHILVLLLTLLDYRIPEEIFGALARDLRVALPKLTLYARSAGCAKADGAYELRAPLHFPLVRKKAGR